MKKKATVGKILLLFNGRKHDVNSLLTHNISLFVVELLKSSYLLEGTSWLCKTSAQVLKLFLDVQKECFLCFDVVSKKYTSTIYISFQFGKVVNILFFQ